jgi:hypothetical protein
MNEQQEAIIKLSLMSIKQRINSRCRPLYGYQFNTSQRAVFCHAEALISIINCQYLVSGRWALVYNLIVIERMLK